MGRLGASFVAPETATDGAGNTSYTTAGLGSTSDLTNSAAMVTDTYKYDAFGAATHAGTSANYWQFAGEQTDAASGMQYLRARYYDPAIGRFMTRDPAPASQTQPQTWNQYPYASNNPTNRVDPTGLRASERINFVTPACLNFVVSLLFVMSAQLFGPWGVLIAAPLLASSIVLAGSQGDVIGIGAAGLTGSGGVTAAGLSQSPLLRSFGLYASFVGVSYGAIECLAGEDNPIPTVPVSN